MKQFGQPGPAGINIRTELRGKTSQKHCTECGQVYLPRTWRIEYPPVDKGTRIDFCLTMEGLVTHRGSTMWEMLPPRLALR